MTSSRNRLITLALAAAAALSVSCKAPPPPAEKATEAGKDAPGAAPSATGPVARVNGVEIGREAFQRQMERTRSRFERAGRPIAPALEARLKENLIRKMIDDELIGQKAKAESVAVSAEELAQKYAEHKQRFGTDEMYQSFLQRTQQNDDDVKADLERNALRDALFAKLMHGQAPTEEEAKKYYEENLDKYKQRDQVRASHILLKVDNNTPAEVKAEKQKKAKELLALAKKKDADFSAIAKEHSEGPTASKGGDLGAFSRGRMVKEFEDAAFAAKPGDIIGPVETKFGYHIIKVFERIPERQRSYDEVKESIMTSLEARAKSKATRDILKQMKADAKIEILEPGVDLERRREAPLRPDGTQLAEHPELMQRGAEANTRVPEPLATNPVAAARMKAQIDKLRIDAAKKAAPSLEGEAAEGSETEPE